MLKQDKLKLLEIEKSLLALMLVNTSVVEDVVSELNENHFTEQKNKAIFNAIKEVNFSGNIDDGINRDIVENHLRKSDKLYNAGGGNYISEIIGSSASFSKPSIYISELKEAKQKRDIINSLNAGIDLAQNSVKSSSELASIVENELISNKFKNLKEQRRSINQIVNDVIKKIDKNKNNEGFTGLETKYSEFDNLTNGLQESDLIILAARPSMGKTSLALNIAINISTLQKDRAKKIAIFTLEMSADQLAQRLLSMKANVSLSKLGRPKKLSEADWNRLNAAKELVAKTNLEIFDASSGIMLNEIITKSRAMARDKNNPKQKGVDLIIIDYLQLISTEERGTRQDEVARISRRLKQLAVELKIPVIALSQLSRKPDTREDKRPMLSDLRESGAIEQDADIVAFLHRPDYYNRDSNENINKNIMNIQESELIIAKHRNGPLGTIKLQFNLSLGIFNTIL